MLRTTVGSSNRGRCLRLRHQLPLRPTRLQIRGPAHGHPQVWAHRQHRLHRWGNVRCPPRSYPLPDGLTILQPGALVRRVRRHESSDALALPDALHGATPARDPRPQHRARRRALAHRGQRRGARAAAPRQPLGGLPRHDPEGRHDPRGRAQQLVRGGR